MRTTALLVLLAASAFAEERSFPLTNQRSPQDLQEMATIIRTILSVKDVAIDNANTFRVGGTPEQLEAAEWLLHRLDKPAGWQPSEQERTNPSARTWNNSVRIYYLANNSKTQGVQERLTILRTVLDTRQVFNYSTQSALAVHATGPELEAIEWLLAALDNPVPSPTYKVNDSRLNTVRVFPLTAGISSDQLNAKVTQVRMKMLKVFPLSSPPIIVARGSEADIADAANMLR